MLQCSYADRREIKIVGSSFQECYGLNESLAKSGNIPHIRHVGSSVGTEIDLENLCQTHQHL